MSKPEPVCGTCGHWQEGVPGIPDGMGLCRRFPPAVLVTQQGLMPVQPFTGQLDWCGEHSVFPQRPFVAPEPTVAQRLLHGVPPNVNQLRGGFRP